MTKKQRELIEILLDNITPDDWPENFPFAAQDVYSGKMHAYFEIPYISPMHSNVWVSGRSRHYLSLAELCKRWSKTIVHRDEFMKRWSERNPVVDSEGWIQWNGGEMPVGHGTLIDVKYRDGVVNLRVKAGEKPSCGSISERCAIDFEHDDDTGDIIAYRLHTPCQQKTQQQLALEKFGTDWHDNEGVQPVDGEILIEVMFNHGAECLEPIKAKNWSFSCEDGLGEKESSFTIMKWRIHSDEKESQIYEKETALESLRKPMPECGEEIPCHFVDIKSPIETQIGGNHYTKLAIQPMRYSMENGLDPLQHTVIKYVTRFRDKNGIEDLEKAKHCIDMLIEFERDK